MIASTPQFALMVGGKLQTVAWKVEFDWPGGAYTDDTLGVQSLELDESTTTDMPDGTRLQAGYPSRALDLVLSGYLKDSSGARLTVEQALNPWATTSPFYRMNLRYTPVTAWLGLYPDGAGGMPELLQKFTGTLDNYGMDPQTGLFTISCLDGANTLRTTVDIPAVVTAPPYNAGLTSEFAVDALLRGATNGAVSSWPAQRPNVVLAAGMRASMWPEVGSILSTSAQPLPTFAPGRFGSGFTYATTTGGFISGPNYLLAANVGTHLFVEFDYTGPGEVLVQIGAAAGEEVTLDITSGQFVLRFSADGLGGTIGTLTWTHGLTNPIYCGFAITLPALGGTGWSANLTASDGTTTLTHASGAQTWSAARAEAAWGLASVTVTPGASSAVVEALQITTETSPVTNEGFVPQAILDPSLNALQVIPAITGDPWQALQAIGDAELAVAGYNGSNIFHFTNRETLQTSAVVRTISSLSSLSALQIQVGSEAYANRVQVPFTGWTFGSAGLLWSLDVPQVVRAGKTRILRASIDTGLITGVDGTVTVLANAHTTTDGNSYYRASIDKAGTVERTGGVTVTATSADSSTILITITNVGTQDAWLVSPANYVDIPVGTPSLWIGGVPVTQANTLTSDSGAVASGEVLYAFPGNDWIQDSDTADELQSDLLKDQLYPTPQLTSVAISPDPRIELMDRVRIQDPSLSGMDEYVVIWGSNTSLSIDDSNALTYTQSIDARPVGPPGAWILGISGRSELGSTTYAY